MTDDLPTTSTAEDDTWDDWDRRDIGPALWLLVGFVLAVGLGCWMGFAR